MNVVGSGIGIMMKKGALLNGSPGVLQMVIFLVSFAKALHNRLMCLEYYFFILKIKNRFPVKLF